MRGEARQRTAVGQRAVRELFPTIDDGGRWSCVDKERHVRRPIEESISIPPSGQTAAAVVAAAAHNSLCRLRCLSASLPLANWNHQVAADLVDCDRLDVTFEDIAGMEDVKRSLQEIISEPLDFPPDLYPVSECVNE